LGTNGPGDLCRLLESLAGQIPPLAHTPAACPTFSEGGPGYSQLNELLLIHGYDRVHDVRRTGSTLLHELSFPAVVIQKALNHPSEEFAESNNRAEHRDARKHMLRICGDYVEGLAAERRAIIGNFTRTA
jgi:hypothetical protein